MVSTTFLNLKTEKQAKIRKALLVEFSNQPLAKAQVAPIVKMAGIARGAFYKYFDDLADSYRYLYGVAMHDIHAAINQKVSNDSFDPQFYLNQVATFVNGVVNSRYQELIKMHLDKNESLIGEDHSQPVSELDSRQWAAMILSHQVIKTILLNPERKVQTMKRLKEVLELLDGEEMG